MTYVDFAFVRKHVTVEQAATWLGLDLKPANSQLRGRCPLHDGGARALAITPERNEWFCFANECKKGGGVIELVAKVKQLSERDAAIEIQKHFLDPHKKVGTAENPLQPLDYLVTEHPFIKELGLTKQTCEHFKAGYAPRGIMRGRLAIPIYDGEKLLTYVGVKPGETPLLPKNFAGGLFGSFEAEFLTEDPLKVLLGHQEAKHVVAILGGVTPGRLQALALHMKAAGIASLKLLE